VAAGGIQKAGGPAIAAGQHVRLAFTQPPDVLRAAARKLAPLAAAR